MLHLLFHPLNFSLHSDIVNFLTQFLRDLCDAFMHPLARGLYGDENECLVSKWVAISENSEFLNSLHYLKESFDFL